MRQLRRTFFAVIAAGVFAVPGLALAYGSGTPDGQPPAEEIICDPAAGLRGAAYGLCVAYCEANDCELDPGQHACDVLLDNFYKQTHLASPPCVPIDVVR